MSKLYIVNFSRSEYAMHIPVFRVLCPSYASEYLESHKIKGKEIKETDQVLIGCTADERKALEALLILREKKLYITLYSERPPTALFLSIVRKLDNISLLFCPESMEDVAHCAEFCRIKKKFMSKSAQRKTETDLLGRFINIESLSETNRLLVFAIAEGLSLKEMQSLTRRKERYIQTCLHRLKERFNVLERRELFSALLKWLSLDVQDFQAG
ncbi:hypothetical protein [Treponema succinifaciens]|uniref:hypothetical protein n=1 Tax=Treponema TaxID=157 RepID=UPI0023F15DCE|nr:hypothetical protein [Treponema succinifaciens]MDD6961533.1 hypothetical protein [Treponema succinifaciens]MDY5118225.1 hypothetical protein [Treponema succinifaciens]MEE0352550.1 hypothetical protein [Treponema sp.]